MKKCNIACVLVFMFCLCGTSLGALSPVSDPTPSNGCSGINCEGLVIDWKCDEFETFDLFFGTSSNDLPLIAEDLTSAVYFDLDALAPSTTYYWRVDVKSSDVTVPGDTWNFTTWSSAPDDDDDDDSSGGGGGGGCSAGMLPAAFGLLMVPLLFLIRR